MSIEIILFGVVALVLVLDFALKGIKKKTTQDDVERIGEEQSKKKAFNFNYILARKRNILTFILLVILFKPLFHTFLFTEYLETTSSDKTYIGVNEPTYRLLNGLVRENLHLFNYTDGKSRFEEDELIIVDSNIYIKNDINLTEIFYDFHYLSGSEVYTTHLMSCDFCKELFEVIKFRYSLINFLNENSYKGFNKDEYILNQDDPKFAVTLDLSKLLVEQWISEGKIQEPKPSLNYLIDFFNEKIIAPRRFYWIKDQWIGGFDMSLGWIDNQNYFQLGTFSGLTPTFKNWYETDKIYQLLFLDGQESRDNIYTLNFEKIYFEGLAVNEQEFDKGTQEFYYNGSWDKKFYYYKKTEREASFNFHFQNIFKLKLWLFAVSFASLGVLVLLFNDKIKAR